MDLIFFGQSKKGRMIDARKRGVVSTTPHIHDLLITLFK
jgi:hypothetical protein